MPAVVPYPETTPKVDYPALEGRVLERWRTEDTFAASIEQRRDAEDYVFYDGPPFANGLPHYGHLLTGFVKDVVPRYQTMRGHRVERRFGWDCHGLPAEMVAEQELGVSGRKAVTEYGIDRFNDFCRRSVLRYTAEWERYVSRQARWVDFDDDYKTMDLPYMESVIWAFKQLWDKGLVYKAHRVMPYSWGAETPLSNFEIRLDDATRPRQDPAVTVRLEVADPPAHLAEGSPLSLLIWTTTPWTLPSNLAVAVHPDIDYAVVDTGGERLVLAAAAVDRYPDELADAVTVGTVPGSALVGLGYRPLFDYFAGHDNAFRVLEGDFVTTEEGTGIVHLAPGFGEEDQRVCEEAGIELVVPVDDQGRFTAEVADWAGENVFEANPAIVRRLRDEGTLVRHDSYEHNYPHCWRTDTPIIYKAVDSWYVRVTEFRDRLVELNQEINWIPEHVRDGQFGRWLEGARDWSISRNRFWGSPIPIWVSDDPEHPRVDVYGSLDEIEADFGVRPDDLHRPTVDALTRPNPDDPSGASTMRRVPEVLDCWFDSGSMPYAQIHYPFENREWFEEHFPADFIVEYIAQTRGWFYTLHVLSTALFDRPPFQNVICHGVVLDEEGRKLSKRLENYPDPERVFADHGADAMRWYLMSSPILRGLDLRIDREGTGFAEVVRSTLNPVWNAFHFFTLYANADGYTATWRTDADHVLDRYILAKTHALVADAGDRLDAYDLAGACEVVSGFVDALNNWYIRRSRERFWAPAAPGSTSRDAYDTLYTVLVTLCEVAAPLLPLLTDEIHRGLTGEGSVHLRDWPDADAFPHDPSLVESMDRVRQAASAALSLREEQGIRVRQPLARLTVAGPGVGALRDHAPLLADEVNVHDVELTEEVAELATFVLKPLGAVVGPLLGAATQEVMAAARGGDWTRDDDGTVEVAGHRLTPDQYELAVRTPEGAAATGLPDGETVVALDTEIDDELAREGLARDLVRGLQQARKDHGLAVSDRIRLRLAVTDELAEAVAAHHDYIAGQVLARELTVAGPTDQQIEVGGRTVGVSIERT